LELIKAEFLPEAWEKSIVAVWEKGSKIYTEYGEYSLDLPIAIRVEKPFSEPRIHLKGVVVGKLKQLFEYVDEVLEGVNDWRVGKDWHYTYHERLFNYTTPDGTVIDQIKYVVEKLSKTPYSRRAQAITWMPWKDINADSPPCVQRLWFRVIDEKLALHVHMRSNDAMKAAFMNMYALTELQRLVAKSIGVEPGYYLHIADSYHIYERDWKWAEKFVKQVKEGSSKRLWMTTGKYMRIACRKLQ